MDLPVIPHAPEKAHSDFPVFMTKEIAEMHLASGSLRGYLIIANKPYSHHKFVFDYCALTVS
jgi:hypothetical protein